MFDRHSTYRRTEVRQMFDTCLIDVRQSLVCRRFDRCSIYTFVGLPIHFRYISDQSMIVGQRFDMFSIDFRRTEGRQMFYRCSRCSIDFRRLQVRCIFARCSIDSRSMFDRCSIGYGGSIDRCSSVRQTFDLFSTDFLQVFAGRIDVRQIFDRPSIDLRSVTEVRQIDFRRTEVRYMFKRFWTEARYIFGRFSIHAR